MATLEEAEQLVGYVKSAGPSRLQVRWFDRGVLRPGHEHASSNDRYLSLGAVEVFSWEEGAQLVFEMTGRMPTRRGSRFAQARPIDPTTFPARVRGRSSTGRASSRDPFSTAEKRVLLERAGYTCQGNGRYWPACDGTLDFRGPYETRILHADHIDPNGDHSPENGQILCGICNSIKFAMDKAAGAYDAPEDHA